MPIYEYRAIEGGCSHCAETFEELQRYSDPALEQCPVCGTGVQRILSACAMAGTGSERDLLKPKNLAEKGFTQYKKAGNGVYEKTAGKGPDVIQR